VTAWTPGGGAARSTHTIEALTYDCDVARDVANEFAAVGCNDHRLAECVASPARLASIIARKRCGIGATQAGRRLGLNE
jgi:hypothetical protein